MHLYHLSLVFDRLRSASLKLKLKKCEFLKTEVDYLGHRITTAGVQPLPSKVSAIEKYERPKTVKQLRGFLGLAGFYRRFIESFAKIAAPLYQATESTSLSWSLNCQLAFDTLRKALCTDVVLVFPDFTAIFRLETDASDYGLGAILSQCRDELWRPLHFWSKHLTKSQRNYSVIQKEALAIVLAVRQFRVYLLGRQFLIFTDHRPLKWLMSMKEPSALISRWLIELSEYDYRIEYKPGKTNDGADGLSRMVDEANMLDEYADDIQVLNHISFDACASSVNDQSADPVIAYCVSLKLDGLDPRSLDRSPFTGDEEFAIYVRNWDCLVVRSGHLFHCFVDRSNNELLQFVVPKPARPVILRLAHDSPFSGHFGIKRTKATLRSRYYWPLMGRDVQHYVSHCQRCQQVKPPPANNRAPLRPINAHFPFELVTSDFTGPFPTSEAQNRYVLIFVDHFTKWAEAFATKDMKTDTLARCFMAFVYRHGAPSRLLTDQGRDYQSELFQQLLELLDVGKLRTTAYHPECDGLSERFNRTLIAMLRSFASQNSRDWDTLLHQLVFAYNTSVHSTTGVSPFEALYGRLPKMPLDLVRPTPSSAMFYADFDQFILQHKSNFNRIYALVDGARAVNVDRFKFQHDRHVRGQSYAVFDYVWLYDTTLKPGRSRKLKRFWKGPYEVLSKLGELNYYIRLVNPGKRKPRKQLVHFNRLKRCLFDPALVSGLTVPPGAPTAPGLGLADRTIDTPRPARIRNRRAGVPVLSPSSPPELEDSVVSQTPVATRLDSSLDGDDFALGRHDGSPAALEQPSSALELSFDDGELAFANVGELTTDASVHSEYGYRARTQIAIAPRVTVKRGRPRTRHLVVTPRVQPARACKRLAQ
jgi:transposase InsO family protein